jgi:hypothetical protein
MTDKTRIGAPWCSSAAVHGRDPREGSSFAGSASSGLVVRFIAVSSVVRIDDAKTHRG